MGELLETMQCMHTMIARQAHVEQCILDQLTYDTDEDDMGKLQSFFHGASLRVVSASCTFDAFTAWHQQRRAHDVYACTLLLWCPRTGLNLCSSALGRCFVRYSSEDWLICCLCSLVVGLPRFHRVRPCVDTPEVDRVKIEMMIAQVEGTQLLK